MADEVAETPQNRTRFLVVNADDFGYCDQRNRGIVESFQNGVVSSASLLPNADKALEAVQLSEEYGIPGCNENSDPENSDLRPQTPKTQTSKTQTPKTQTPKTQTSKTQTPKTIILRGKLDS